MKRGGKKVNGGIMNKIFQKHLSLCIFTTAVLFFVHDANTKVQADAVATKVQSSTSVNGKAQNSKNQFSCDKSSSSSYRCNDGKRHIISQKTYQLTNNGDEAVAIEASQKDTRIAAENITITGKNDKSGRKVWGIGAKASEEGSVELSNSTLKDVLMGMSATQGTIQMKGGSIDASKVGVSVTKGTDSSKISGAYLANTNIKTSDKAIGLFINDSVGSKGRQSGINMEGGTIDFTNGTGVKVEGAGSAILNNVSITGRGSQVSSTESFSESSAFHILKSYGYIDFCRGKIDVFDAHGLLIQGADTDIYISESTVVVKGSDAFYGMRFLQDPEAKNNKRNSRANIVVLEKTSFTVPHSTAIYNSKVYSSVRLSKGAVLSGDLLLRADDSSYLLVKAGASSTLVGGARTDENSDTELWFREGAKWILTRPKNGNLLENSSSIGDSSISLINFIDGSVVFEQPSSSEAGNYQTLRIGKGTGKVYNVRGNAHLYLNTYLDKGGDIKDQKTDRVLIYGDVEGKTIVHVQSVLGSPGGYTGSGGNSQGISIIQVSGKAEKDSFQLDGDYVALNDLPYQYKLYAYGPESDLGEADSSQRLVEGKEKFWDFRLQNRYVAPPPEPKPGSALQPKPGSAPQPSPKSILEPKVRAVVPQVPTYLLLSNSLFHAGLMDISNQNKQLETLRTASNGMLKMHKNPVSFLRGYGGNYRYISDLSALEYGYGGDLSYNGVEAGVLLQTIENADNSISFGVMASYGKLFLQPLDVEQSQKSAFDKWTATAYGSMQHDAGFYVDALLSYGHFEGDVVTLARGKTATLKGNPLSVSLTGGQTLAMGYKGFVFDPQVQIVYQHLQFSKVRDIDNFNIEMGKLDQWVARVGGRLSKTLTVPEKDSVFSLYGKLHLAHGFEEKKSVYFKDAFQLGAFGSSLEAGLGLNAQLSQKFVLHADLTYQHNLTKAGFSGISFSGGLRYRF